MKRFVLGVVLMIFLGCSPSVTDLGYLDEDYEGFIEQISKLEKTTMRLYEGLPHPEWEWQLFETESQKSGVIERGGHLFYEQFQDLDEESSSALQTLLLKADSYERRVASLKGCGGFHPDYDVVFLKEGEEVHLLICFGCDEVNLVRNDKVYMVDIEGKGSAEEVFREVLGGFRVQRPSTDLL